jgi:hypothetical protein
MNLPSMFAQNYSQLPSKKQRHPTAPNLHSARPSRDLLPAIAIKQESVYLPNGLKNDSDSPGESEGSAP